MPYPPGPRTLTPWGVRSRLRRDVLGFYGRLARDHPAIASFRVFWIRVVFLSDPGLIQRLLRRDEGEVGRPWDLRELRIALGDGLLTSEGDTWRRHRRLVQPAFRHQRLVAYGPLMVRRAREAAEGWSDGAVLDLHAEMSRLTLAIAAEALFGSDLSDETWAIGEALETVMDRFEEVFISSWLPLPLAVPTPGNLRLRRAIRKLHAIAERLIRRRRAAGPGGDDLMSALLEAAEPVDGGGLTDRELRDEVLTLLLAGHETTALALTWTLFLLARHPEEESRLLDELREVLGDRDPGPDDLARLPRLKRVVQESLRLYPPAWGLGREAARDLEIAGYDVPAGAQIFALQWVTHRDGRFFHRPERFWPDRWLPDAPSGTDGVPAADRNAYFPFGSGARACVGAGFALMEAPLVLATLLRRWRVEVDPGAEVELQPAVTLRPRGGLEAAVRRRSP